MMVSYSAAAAVLVAVAVVVAAAVAGGGVADDDGGAVVGIRRGNSSPPHCSYRYPIRACPSSLPTAKVPWWPLRRHCRNGRRGG